MLAVGRAQLAEHGWRQGDFGEAPGPMCALGALNSAWRIDTCNSHMLHVHMQCRGYLAEVIAEQYPKGTWINAAGDCHNHPASVALWNDTRGRTVDEVLAVYEKAIAAAQEAGD